MRPGVLTIEQRRRAEGGLELVIRNLLLSALKVRGYGMQSTGQRNENRSMRILLLLVVGLAAFSSAMKELNQVHDLTLQTSQLLAQWSGVFMPEDQTPILAKVETCENSKIVVPPPPPVPAVPAVPAIEPQVEIVAPAAVPVPPAPPKVREPRVIKSQRAVRTTHDAAEVRVLLSTDELVEKSFKYSFDTDVTFKALKGKNRRHILIGPDGRDVILKSLNRSITLRSAS